MPVYFRSLFLVAALVLSSGAAWSQGEFSGDVDFSAPDGPLEPDTKYEFKFTVQNTSTPSDVARWIRAVDLYMPSALYVVDEEDVQVPRAIHEDDVYWEAWVSRDDVHGLLIRWEVIALLRNFIGDIHEGESLDFKFKARTDSVPTDGFDWVLMTDLGEMVTGTEKFGTTGGGDDDTGDDADDDTMDDDDNAVSNDEDDDDNDGCGC